ncbi:SRPBCC family protein [Cellulosimicrobium arenosum]|uniref:SRPBCC family protein n=1 Tax=Cellulosimicrobium arenosum TaxID=2708133 RepID=A0A927IZX0_9MICO|nr:SRPBCC family protein [Cellulosimicrobium arenosum]MBD8079030.1 SRPBCC family protein [Cellulosimicrobium arenosum]
MSATRPRPSDDAEPSVPRRPVPGRGVVVARDVPVDASVAFAWVADLRTHPRFIPLTRMATPATRGPEVGDRVTMVSGPLVDRTGRGFRDRMVVESLVRPSTTTGRRGSTRVRKEGPVLLGDAGFVVVPQSADRCRVVWWEDAYLAGPLPRRVSAPLVGIALRWMMRVSLRRLGLLLTR